MLQEVELDRVSPRTRRLYTLASALALVGNLALLLAKALASRVSGSSAIYADAANSASDVAYSVLMGVGLWCSLRPPDLGHPHGHRRIEPLVSLAIGGLMAFAAYQGARAGWGAWVAGTRPTLGTWPVVVLLGTGVVKALMYVTTRRLGNRANSPALLASARDHLSDTVSSATALIGLILSRWLFVADPVAAWLVSAWILRNAIEILRDGIDQVIGGAASPELRQAIIEAVQGVSEVIEAERVIIEHVGPQVYADIHIKMDGEATLYRAHYVSHIVRETVEALDDVDHAYVHVEPLPPYPDWD